MNNGAAILDQLVAILRRHLGLRAAEYVVLAVWIIHTYCFEQFRHTPYLDINSPEKQSGKTTLLDVIEPLVHNPKRADSISPAALYRLVHKYKPSLMLDEIDALIRSGKETSEAIRGILNSGFKRNGTTTRCTGKNMDQLAEFSTYCPKVIAGIGELWDTVHDRSITIRMRKLGPGESVQPVEEETLETETKPLKEQIERWVAANKKQLAERPVRLDGVNSYRRQDIVVPLLAIAETAGGEYPQALRSALAELFNSAPADDQSHRVALLSDIRRIFVEQNTERLFTKDLISELKAIEGAAWSSWNKGQGIAPHDLSKNLRGFEIESRKIRIGAETKQGYTLDMFEDAFTRYLPQEIAE